MRDLIDLTEQELNDVLMKPFVTFPYFHFVSINLSLISLGIFLQTSHLLGLVAYLPAIAFQSTWTLVQRSAEPKSLLRPAYRLLYRLRPVRVVRISLFLYVLAWLICLDICTDPTATVIPGFSLFENFFNLQACTFLMPFIIPLFICHSNVMKLLIASLGYLALLILPGDYLAAGLFRQNLLLVLVGYVSGLLIAATLMVVCGLYYQNIKQKMEIEKTLMLLHVIMMNTSSAMVLINEKMQTVGKPSASFDRIFGKQLDLFQILKTQSDLGQDDLHKLKEAIMMTVGEDRLAFELIKAITQQGFPLGLGRVQGSLMCCGMSPRISGMWSSMSSSP